MINQIQRMIDYVNTVKPYHSKILDVTVRYSLDEPISVGGPSSDVAHTVISESISFQQD